MDTSEIKAILDEDFENLLRRLNVYDAVVNGTVTCEYCHEGITLDNISMVFPKNGQVCFCCDKKECTEQLMSKGEFLNESNRSDNNRCNCVGFFDCHAFPNLDSHNLNCGCLLYCKR